MAELIWYPQRGYGVCGPDKAFNYNDPYIENFARLGDSLRGRALNKARVEFVARHTGDNVIDFGAGACDFIRAHGQAYGYDIARKSKVILHDLERFIDVWEARDLRGMPLTCWDSFEHLKNPRELLDLRHSMIFMTIPIFESCEHALVSHHFKPNEHIYYFTEGGLRGYMLDSGYEMVERSDFETRFGRKDVMSYAFHRAS